MSRLSPWLAATRFLALFLILANLVYAGRLLAAGLAGVAGVDSILGVDPVIVMAIADDPAWKFLSRIVLIAGYALLAFALVWRVRWIVFIAVPLFVVDHCLWLWATSQLDNTLVHNQLDPADQGAHEMLDWVKFVVKNAIFVLSLSVAVLAVPRSRRWLPAE